MSFRQGIAPGVYSATYPSEYGNVALPKLWAGDGTIYPVIALHGATGAEWSFFDSAAGQPTLVNIVERIVSNAGKPVFAINAQGDAFGNTACRGSIDDAITYMASAFGCKTGKAHLLGASMGGGECYAYAREHPTKVASITAIIPMSNLQATWSANRLGLAASINTAAGGTYVPATHGPTMDPTVFAAQLAGIPTDIWYSADDVAVLPAEVLAVAALIGSSARVNAALSGAHGDAAISTISAAGRQSICDFIRAHAA